MLNTASSDAEVAVDDTDLYVCLPGSLYRMNKYGGGTQNYQGADVDTAYTCRAVAVDDESVWAVWFDATAHHLKVARWTKSDRAAPADGFELDDVSDAYVPYMIADGGLYYADRTEDELVLGRLRLDDYADATLLSIDAEFDSEYLQPLAVQGDALYYQTCEQVNRWCSLFVQLGADSEPTPYEQLQRDSVVASLVTHADGILVALLDGVYSIAGVDAELVPVWASPGTVSYGPLLTRRDDLYVVSIPYSNGGSIVWRLPLE